MKRQDISRLRKNRITFLQIGFIISLSFVLLAFNWTTKIDKNETTLDPKVYETEPLEIIRTPYDKKPVLPPPVVKAEPVIEEIEPIEFTEEPDLEPLDPEIVSKTQKVLASETNFTQPAPPVIIPEEPEEEIIFKVVEEMPRFPGCEGKGLSKKEKKSCADKALLTYLAEHLKYPALAREIGYQGKVVIRFIVEKDGSITNIELMRDIGGGCGAEAIRVLKSMPDWKPGMQRGHPVRVQFNLPVTFRLQ